MDSKVTWDWNLQDGRCPSMPVGGTWLKWDFFFPGVGRESVLLKGDEVALETTETSCANMTIKVRDSFSSRVLKVHRQRKVNLWQTSRGRMSASCLPCWCSFSTPHIRFPEIWDLRLGNHRFQDVISSAPVVGSPVTIYLYIGSLQVVTPWTQ